MLLQLVHSRNWNVEIYSHLYQDLFEDEDRLQRFFAMNIHQLYSLQIAWWCLSMRINFSHFIYELKKQLSCPVPGKRLTKMKPALLKFMIRPNARASNRLDPDGVYPIPNAATVTLCHSFVNRIRFGPIRKDWT
jgi:hypothetical protein